MGREKKRRKGDYVPIPTQTPGTAPDDVDCPKAVVIDGALTQFGREWVSRAEATPAMENQVLSVGVRDESLNIMFGTDVMMASSVPETEQELDVLDCISLGASYYAQWRQGTQFVVYLAVP